MYALTNTKQLQLITSHLLLPPYKHFGTSYSFTVSLLSEFNEMQNISM